MVRDTANMSSQIALSSSERPFAIVDLIGDLDATLGTIFADTLDRLVASGTTDVLVTARHVATSSNNGLATLGAACTAAREHGTTITIDPGNRRMRSAFASASLTTDRSGATPRPRGARHVMIACHALSKRLARTA